MVKRAIYSPLYLFSRWPSAIVLASVPGQSDLVEVLGLIDMSQMPLAAVYREIIFLKFYHTPPQKSGKGEGDWRLVGMLLN
jgi:hypothetical protein